MRAGPGIRSGSELAAQSKRPAGARPPLPAGRPRFAILAVMPTFGHGRRGAEGNRDRRQSARLAAAGLGAPQVVLIAPEKMSMPAMTRTAPLRSAAAVMMNCRRGPPIGSLPCMRWRFRGGKDPNPLLADPDYAVRRTGLSVPFLRVRAGPFRRSHSSRCVPGDLGANGLPRRDLRRSWPEGQHRPSRAGGPGPDQLP